MSLQQASHKFQIYTDGGCLPNRRGAWAFLILNDEQIFCESSGMASSTTSVRMELEAAVQALKVLPENSRCILWTDSRVVIEIVEIKIPQWKNNGWLRSRGQKVIDLDLILQLDQLLSLRQVEWRWVRAHSGNKHNEHCDTVCRLALEKR